MDTERDSKAGVDSTPKPRADASDAATDFAWPPAPEDLDACVVVPLTDGGLDRSALLIGGFPMREADPRLRRKSPGVFTIPVTVGGFPLHVRVPASHAPSAVPPPLPPPLPVPAPVAAAVAAAEPEPAPEPEPVHLPLPVLAEPAAHEHVLVTGGLWAVEEMEPELPPVEVPEVVRETSSIGPRLRASLTLAVAASLALLSWSQFKGLRRDAVPPSSPAQLSVSALRVPAPVTAMPAVLTTTLTPPTPVEEPVDEAIVEAVSERPAPQIARQAPRPTPPPTPPPAPRIGRMAPAPALARTEPRPAPQPITVPEIRQAVAAAPAAPAPAITLAVAADAPVAVAAMDAGPSEEDGVRSTLAHWRTAYSQLDARAAKRVYPGLDVRALERAFQGLKSQDVRFDRCELTMHDGSAQANCTGRATFVPRVGSQSPITTQRQWRFELKRFDQGWTIASARTAAS